MLMEEPLLVRQQWYETLARIICGMISAGRQGRSDNAAKSARYQDEELSGLRPRHYGVTMC